MTVSKKSRLVETRTSARASSRTSARASARAAERSVSEAVEAVTYTSLKRLVERLEASAKKGAPVGQLVYQLVDIGLRSGFLLGRAYEHAGLKGASRVTSGVSAIDALFERVRRVETRVLSMLGSKSGGAIRGVRSLGPSGSLPHKPTTKPSVLGSRGAAAGKASRGGAKKASRGQVKKAERVLTENWGGLSKHRSISTFNRRQIERGAKVEIEHTGKARKRLARRIAADHLIEDPRYYDKLEAAGLDAGIIPLR